jgi:hypothetical protein
MKARLDYLNLRRPFQPSDIRLVIIAESPPVSGRYFYDSSGRTTEPLFSALMKQCGITPRNKEQGLREFQKRGWILVDATYEPVNDPEVDRDAIILRDYPLLRDDLLNLLSALTAPLVLIKANVCRLLDARLSADGFNVLNRGRAVYFPSNGRQGQFAAQFSEIVGSESG